VKFLKAEQDFFTKINTRIMSIRTSKQTIIIHNFNFDEKILVRFKKFIEKMTKLHHFFQNQDQIETKNIWGPTYYFWTKIGIKRVIPNFLYKLVETLYLLFL